MRHLKLDAAKDHIDSDLVLVLQLRTANQPFLPCLEDLSCENTTDEFIPFIPLFISPRTASITITLTEHSSTTVAVGAVISRFPALCPNLECIYIEGLARDPVTINAVSELLLACNGNSLESFCVDSPLTEEAQEVLFRLPNLSVLWAVMQRHTLLPSVALPNLTLIDVEYSDGLDWLRGFRGAVLGKLESAIFRCESEQIGDFLGAFGRVAVTTTAQNTLSSFRFCTSSGWNPNYSALLPFRQLKELTIEFSCDNGCSSRVDDDVIAALALAMPKLETLRLGGDPCQTPTGATVKGLVTLASRCPYLSELRIHFQAASLVDAATSAMTTPIDDDESAVQWEDCVLTDLEVGRIPVPPQSTTTIILTLLNIFPCIINVKYTNQEWKAVAETLKNFGRIGALVRHIGKAHRRVLLCSGLNGALPGRSN